MSRSNLHAELKTILGSENVYYQPPETQKIKYPAIIYKRETIDPTRADNLIYLTHHKYNIVVIDKNPDSQIVETLSKFNMCRHVRHYAENNMNYDVFTLYYDE